MKIVSSSLWLSLLCIIFNNAYSMDPGTMDREVEGMIHQRTIYYKFEPSADPKQIRPFITGIKEVFVYELANVENSSPNIVNEHQSEKNYLAEIFFALCCYSSQEHEL